MAAFGTVYRTLDIPFTLGFDHEVVALLFSPLDDLYPFSRQTI
jgi:hypothetical protein